MRRRDFLTRSAAVGGAAFAPTRWMSTARAAAGTLDLYTDSDANVSDFWTNVIAPAFAKVRPDATINVVIAREGGGTEAIAARTLAALGSDADPRMDYIEQFDPRLPDGAIEAGLWVDFAEAGLDRYDTINPLAIDSPYSLPYRGSQVLLAYDPTKLDAADAPRTFADLVDWIKAHPGQFIYNRPDKGGSGGNFVRRAIHEANGRDPSRFTVDNYSPETGGPMLAAGFDLLRDLAPSLYGEGAYTSGNTQSVQLLAQGVVTMVPVWSDQALQAIAQGVLPENTGLVQLTDLALAGGFSRTVVPTNAANRELALELASFVLDPGIQSRIVSELGGFPGVSWEFLPDELAERYADVVPGSIPTFPEGDWSSAVSDGWYRTVAPSLKRDG